MQHSRACECMLHQHVPGTHSIWRWRSCWVAGLFPVSQIKVSIPDHDVA